MNQHKIILFVVVLAFIFFFGFLATYSSQQRAIQESARLQDERPIGVVPTDASKPVENIPDTSIPFGSTVSLPLSSSIVFSDGLTITLKEINDSRCPLNVQCVWAGELAVLLGISDGRVETTQEIRLGTVNNKSMALGEYMFTLNDATTTNIRLTVIKK